jgi:hypothetical protein
MSMAVFEYTPYDKITEVPQTATAFANRGAYGNMLFAMGWTKEEHDNEIRECKLNIRSCFGDSVEEVFG